MPIFPLDLSVCLRPLLTERSASRQSRLSLKDSALTQSIEDSSDGAALVNEFHSFVRTRTAWENICSVIMIGCKCKSVCTTAETTTSVRASFFEHVCAARRKKVEGTRTDSNNAAGTVQTLKGKRRVGIPKRKNAMKTAARNVESAQRAADDLQSGNTRESNTMPK